MSTEQEHKISTSTAKQVVIFLTVAFAVFQVLVATGLIEIQNNEYLPPNMQTPENWYDNPVIWVIGVTILVNFAGYIENVVVKNQAYDYNMFIETFFKYMPMLLIFSQFLPNEQSGALAFALDYLHRTFKKS